MAEKQAGSEHRRGSVRGALAALGMLAAPEALASDRAVEKPGEAPVAEQVAGDFSLRLRDCTVDANRAFLLELAEQVGEELSEDEVGALLADFPEGETAAQTLKWTLGESPEAKAWVLQQVRANGKPWLAELVASLKAARIDGFKVCDSENDEIVIAALDARIATATAKFAEHGFRVGETEEGETMLFHPLSEDEEIPAAHFVQDGATGAWTLDFAPLAAYREGIMAETEELEAQNELIQADIDDMQANIDAMEARIREIWEQIQNGEMIEPERAAALQPAPDVIVATTETKI